MKINFPFFSKKLKSVCTTKQIIHEVDGEDKRLSDVLGDTSRYGLLRINGKELYEMGGWGYDLTSRIQLWAPFSPISYIYHNKGFDLQITTTSENHATFKLYNDVISLTCDLSLEVDPETGDSQLVVANFRILPYNEVLQEILEEEVRSMYESVDTGEIVYLINIDNA